MSRIESTKGRREKCPQDEQVAFHRSDLRWRRAGLGVSSRDRRLDHLEAESGSANRKIVVQLVAREHVAQRLHAWIGEQSPTVGPKSVRRISVTASGGDADERGVEHANANRSIERRVD